MHQTGWKRKDVPIMAEDVEARQHVLLCGVNKQEPNIQFGESDCSLLKSYLILKLIVTPQSVSAISLHYVLSADEEIVCCFL